MLHYGCLLPGVCGSPGRYGIGQSGLTSQLKCGITFAWPEETDSPTFSPASAELCQGFYQLLWLEETEIYMHFIHWPIFDGPRMLSSDALVYKTKNTAWGPFWSTVAISCTSFQFPIYPLILQAHWTCSVEADYIYLCGYLRIRLQNWLHVTEETRAITSMRRAFDVFSAQAL